MGKVRHAFRAGETFEPPTFFKKIKSKELVHSLLKNKPFTGYLESISKRAFFEPLTTFVHRWRSCISQQMLSIVKHAIHYKFTRHTRDKEIE